MLSTFYQNEQKTRLLDEQNDALDSSFQPSFVAKVISHLMAPSTLVSLGVVGGALTFTASWPLLLATGGVVFTAHRLFTNIVAGGEVLRSSVFTLAEHLSALDIRGGLPYLTIPPMLKALEKIETKEGAIARNCLESILNFSKHLDYSGLCNSKLVNDLISSIEQLNVGEQTGILISYLDLIKGGHIIVGTIQRCDVDHFVVRIHNGGEGLNYHYVKIDAERTKSFQTTLEITDVSLPNLKKFMIKAMGFNSFGINKNVSMIYEALLLLQGKIQPPSSNRSFWSSEQTGSSCSGFAVRCLIKSILPPEKFKHFETYFLNDSVHKLKEGIEKGRFWEATQEHQLAYQELKNKLVRWGGEDVGPLQNTALSMQSMMASKVQKRFWDIFFSLSWGMATALGGVCDIDRRKIGKVKEFKEMQDAYENHEEWEAKKRFSKDKQEVLEAYQAAIGEFKTQYKKLYQKIDRSTVPKEELKRLDKHASEVASQAKLEFFCSCATATLYQCAFAQLKIQFKDSEALCLYQVIQYLKEKKYASARTLLIQSYHNIDKVNLEELQDYHYVVASLLNMNTPLTLEGIELYSGLVTILNKLKLDLPSCFSAVTKRYRLYELDQEFPDSPWRVDLIQSQKNLEEIETETPSNLQELIKSSLC